MQGSLLGIKVVDFGAFGVGPMAAGFLATMGAEAIRIEPPVGDGLMYIGTLIGGMGSGYISAHYNKKNIVLDLRSEKGRDIALELVRWADVFIENRRLGALERRGLGYEAVAKVNPRIIYVSSTSYGHKGPWAHYAAADPYVQAATGFASCNGKENGDAELLRYYVHVDTNATIVILEAVLLGLLAREITGEGQKIETSHFEAGIAAQTSRIAEFLTTGVNPKCTGSASSLIAPSQSFLAQDNKYINISVPREEYWPKLCRALELQHLQNDPRFETNAQRLKHRAELIPLLEEKIQREPTEWWLIHLRRCDVPCGLIYTYQDIIRDPHILENQMIIDVETPWGVVKFSNTPLRLSGTLVRPIESPVLPDHNRDEILGLLEHRPWMAKYEVADSLTPKDGNLREESRVVSPLEGLKVIDLTEEISGPFCSMQLGDAGAEVIKIEPPLGDLSRSLGPRIKDESAIFIALNRNKKSIVVDVKREAGREIVYQLVKSADIFIEDFPPSQVNKLGLSYEDIRRINPNILFLSISPFSESGPYKDRCASELEIQGMSGYMWFLGEPGEPPVRVGTDIAAIAAGIWGFIGILAALYYRCKTGYGQKVEVSMLGALIAAGSTWLGAHSNPDMWGGYHLTGPYDHAETGYRTKDVPIIFGLHTGTPEQAREAWERFCKRLGLQGLLSDPWFKQFGPRSLGIGKDAQDLRALYESATENKMSEELIKLIDEVGGMGAPILNYEQLFGEPLHPQVAATQMIQEMVHPMVGKIRTIGFPWKLQKTQPKLRSASPALGEHTEEVLIGLGYDRKTIAKLKSGGVIT